MCTFPTSCNFTYQSPVLWVSNLDHFVGRRYRGLVKDASKITAKVEDSVISIATERHHSKGMLAKCAIEASKKMQWGFVLNQVTYLHQNGP